MSLKGFHIIFITLSTLCLVGFASWTFVFNTDGGLRIAGVVSGILAVLLLGYGVWFYQKKLKNPAF